MKNHNLQNNILPRLLGGDINKNECIDLILEEFSDFEKIHNNLKEGDEIIYNGNKGYLIKKGLKKSIIRYRMMGKIPNKTTNPEIELYNIEFYKTPNDYWD
jgi:hypothetical protein